MNVLAEKIQHKLPTQTRPRGWCQLASRSTGGITVGLHWKPKPDGDEVFVHVSDEQTGESIVLEPRKEDALTAFYHPYVLRPSKGAD